MTLTPEQIAEGRELWNTKDKSIGRHAGFLTWAIQNADALLDAAEKLNELDQRQSTCDNCGEERPIFWWSEDGSEMCGECLAKSHAKLLESNRTEHVDS